MNFSLNGKQVQLSQSRFAHNTTFEQAFPDGLHGINRPVDLKFWPDDCAYLVDYGAVRDFGQSAPASKFIDPGNGQLVQIPGSGAIWRSAELHKSAVKPGGGGFGRPPLIIAAQATIQAAGAQARLNHKGRLRLALAVGTIPE